MEGPLPTAPPPSPRPHVVIVGASFAGLSCLRHLRGFKSLDVTVVDPKEYFEYTPGVPHLLAGSHGDLLSPLPALAARCGATRVLCGRFMGVDAAGKRVAVATGAPGAVEVLSYDALVVCSGMPYAAPIGHAAGSTPLTLEHRLKDLAAYTERLSGSKHVIVAGGGLVGVELAAELSVRLQGKVQQVTLIARSSLLATLPAAAGRHALAWLQGRKNVRVLLNDEVVGCDNPVMADGGVYKTKSGQELRADMYIDCTGAGGSNSSSSSSHRAGALAAAAPQGFLWPLNTRGLLRVDERLQATDLSPAAAVFAAGDVLEHAPGAGFACTTPRAPYGTLTANPAVRNAHLAESQAELVGHNVAALLGVSAGPPHFHAYPRDLFGAELCPLVACVSLGPYAGILIFNDLVLGGFFFGALAAFAKYVIERSIVAKIRDHLWAKMFWAFGHLAVNSQHALYVRIKGAKNKKV